MSDEDEATEWPDDQTDFDPWINAAGRRASFQRHAPEATTEVVLEAGHCPHDEVPEQVNAALLSWLESLAATPVSPNTSNFEPSL